MDSDKQTIVVGGKTLTYSLKEMAESREWYRRREIEALPPWIARFLADSAAMKKPR